MNRSVGGVMSKAKNDLFRSVRVEQYPDGEKMGSGLELLVFPF